MYKISRPYEEREELRRNLTIKLNDIGSHPANITEERKFMFVILLIQYLHSMNIGIESYDNGGVLIENPNKLRAWCDKDNSMYLFIVGLVQIRHRIITDYGFPGPVKLLNDVWKEKDMKTLCKRLGITFETEVIIPECAKLMSGE